MGGSQVFLLVLVLIHVLLFLAIVLLSHEPLKILGFVNLLVIAILLILVLIIIEVNGHLSASSQEFGVVFVFILHSSNRRLGW